MKNLKLLLAAMSFVAAAGVAGAGTVYISGQNAGTFSGEVKFLNGSIYFATADINGSGENTCPNDTSIQDGCQTEPTDDCATGTDADLLVPGCQDDGDGNNGGGGTPANCEDVNYTPPGNRSNGITQFARFPGYQGSQFSFSMRNGEYLAIKFTAPVAGYAGMLDVGAGFTEPSDLHTMVISECPGDFTETLPPQGVCMQLASIHDFYWSTRGSGSGDADIACMLDPGKTYFLNIAYATGPNLDTPTCSSTVCGQLVAWRIIFQP